MKKWFKLSYKSLRETVVYLQGKRKEKEAEMFAWFQFRSFSDTMEYIKPLFRQNKHLKLHKSKIFRAWYKHQIDYMLERPDIYTLTVDGGEPYRPEDDNFYDPKAPAWSEYALKCEYDDDDESEDDLLDWDPFAKDKAQTWRQKRRSLRRGSSFPIGNTLFGRDDSRDSGCDCGG